MPLPSIEKTWSFDVNKGVVAGTTVESCGQRTIFQVKQSILTLPGWTVKGSSDNVTAGMDGVDRLDTYTDWVSRYSAGTRSWIVFKNTLSGLELLLEGSAASSTNENRYMRPFYSVAAGFSGGSTTARPTASDEISFASTSTGDAVVASTVQPHVVHVMGSSDGSAVRVFVLSNGVATYSLIVGTLGDALPGVLGNYWAGAQSGSTAFGIATWLATNGARLSYNSTAWTLALSTISIGTVAFSSSNAMTVPDVTGAWNIVPILIAGEFSSSTTVFGRCIDLWFGATSRPHGSTYPEDGTNTFAQFGNLVVPWNGSNPVVA